MKKSVPRKIGVIADDLTGAGDVGLAFHAAGFSVDISLWQPGLRSPGRRSNVWVIDTASRALPPGLARARVRRASGALRLWGARFIYKKIDSTLRGPLAAELQSFIHALRPPAGEKIVLAPAFPRMGRSTRAGFHFVDGRPLDKTVFARDPSHPARTAFIPGLLGPHLFRRFLVPDVEKKSDLKRLVFSIQNAPGFYARAAVGSAGLAEALAQKWKKRARPALAKKSKALSPVLVVAGSAHPRTARQLRPLRRFLKSRGAVLLKAPAARGNSKFILRRLMRRARAAAKGFQRFVATGGETARALCDSLRARRWRVAGRVATGVPVLVSLDRPGLWLVTKPGGFGADDILVKSVKRLESLERI